MVLYAHTQLTKGQPTVLNSTEVLVYLPGYEGIYKASSLGYITNGRKKLKTYTINSGYLCLKLHDANGVRKSHLLHRLIAQAFIPNPSNFPEVNHIDGIKANCALDNLEWQTSQGNKKHAKETGLWKYNKPSTGIKEWSHRFVMKKGWRGWARRMFRNGQIDWWWVRFDGTSNIFSPARKRQWPRYRSPTLWVKGLRINR